VKIAVRWNGYVSARTRERARNETLNTKRLGCAGNNPKPIAGLGLGRGVYASMVDTRRLLLGAILRMLQGRNVNGEEGKSGVHQVWHTRRTVYYAGRNTLA
jgi:hypothetical protein